jgi:DNA end-binding protein Ku
MPTAWKGSISFGLVNIPITLTPAFSSKDLDFHLLHKKDHGRIGYQKYCKKCGQVVQQEDMIKAFEHEKDSFIPLSKEELDAGKAPNTRNLEISLFVPADDIDTMFYEKPYYVLPAKKSENLYVLLREAIRSSGLVGIGKIQFGNREHLAALKSEGAAILLNLMHFIEEREDPKQLGFPPQNTVPGKKELDLAKQLVGTLKGHFQPEKFENAHRAHLEETIRRKAGKAFPAEEGAAPATKGKVIDLMERLKQSLAKGGAGGTGDREEGRNTAQKTARKSGAAKASAAMSRSSHGHAAAERPIPRKKAG